MTTNRTWCAVAALGLSIGLITGCEAVAASDQINVVEPAATVIPSGTADPRASAAVSTYKWFLKTTHHILRHPVRATKGGGYPDDSDFTKYSMDPVQTQYEDFVDQLIDTGHAFRGAAPKSTVTVKAIDLKAQPNPLITLSDCQTERGQWRAYNTATDAMNPQMTPALPAPYGLTVTLAFLQPEQRWSVQTISPDPAGTCPG